MDTDTGIETVETTEGDADEGPKGLREALKRAEDANAKMRSQLLDRAFKDLGLDDTQGLGKAVAKEYDGDPTTEALGSYLIDEYSWQSETQVSGVAEAVTQGQEVEDAVNANSDPVTAADPLQSRVSEAVETGDVAAEIAAKAAQVTELFNK